ncbi:MAG TPA: DivIVA domain-containing protein [Gemmatimonadales bacterium]|jgi:DivIVA domain-containing protein|nr:DivIVA domain-containing protein [Gemmatimonadales bacterium]
MNDEIFHLTPHDVRAQEFGRGFRGYAPVEVEEFRGRVAEELDRLLRERAQLEERIRGLQEQLRSFREREKAMNDALVAAQQLRADAKAQSEREAEAALREAKTEAMRVLARAEEQERVIRERFEAAQRQFATYLANFRALLERQLGEVEGLQASAQARAQLQVERGDSQTELVLKRKV